MAKTVMVKIDGDLVMAVLPATYQVDLYELMGAFGADRVQLATEDDFRHLFPGCELGAMPPFGNLYGVDVYVARELTEQEEMAFNAGSHTEILRMPYRDYARLVMPLVLDFAVPERAAA
jgi:Ala-tRNA(Pro) deacylase